MTYREFADACEGYAESKGARRAAPMTQAELDDLLTMVDAEGNLLASGERPE
jgi:hypothetical protein